MKTIKASEATIIQLNWLVARCEGDNITLMRNDNGSLFPMPVWADGLRQLNYATSWAQMGPIIERERIVCDFYNHIVDGDDQVHARLCRAKLKPDGTSNWYAPKRGPNILIAAARCYVASKLGETVEVPEEL